MKKPILYERLKDNRLRNPKNGIILIISSKFPLYGKDKNNA